MTQCLQHIRSQQDLQSFPFLRLVEQRQFQRVAIDLFVPLPSSDVDHKYVLVMQDTFTKFVEFYPLVWADAPSVLATIVDIFIPRHGARPTSYLTMALLLTRHSYSPWCKTRWLAYLFTCLPPSVHGLVERMMGTSTDVGLLPFLTLTSSNLMIVSLKCLRGRNNSCL
jgi:hypothetical protein